MSKLIALFAVLLILTGVVLVAVPRDPAPAATRSAGPAQVSFVSQIRDVADQINGPLSILFGLISLYYSRKTYLAQSKH